MVVGGKDRRLHEVDAAPTDVLLPPKMRMSSAISGPQVSGVGELQGLDANLVALAPARGALDDVDQLAHVARPAIAAQARLGIAGQAEDSAVTAGEPIREVARQRDDVVGALA